MEENYDKERKELLDNFRNALRQGSQSDSSWFDEDDLLDIFDYAGDTGNDYLRAEALMWGARYFPDSERLRERRAVFYSDVLTDKDVADFSDDNGDSVSFLTEIVALRARNLTGEEALDAIKDLLKRYDRLDDEECIQLVNLAADTNNLRWLLSALPSLKKRAEYLPALLYEAAASAYDAGLLADAEKLMDELVEENPYSAEFWSFLARIQADKDATGSEASESMEMALAIDPSNIEALRLKAKFLSVSDRQEDRLALEKLAGENKDDAEIAVSWLDAVLKDQDVNNATDEVRQKLMEYAKKFPQDETIFALLVMYAPEEARQAITKYWQGYNDPERLLKWRNWVSGLTASGAFRGAREVVRCIINNNDSPVEVVSPELALDAELSFKLGEWENALTAVDIYERNMSGSTPVLMAVKMIALIKVYRFKESVEYAANLLKRNGTQIKMPSDSNAWGFGVRLSLLGLQQLATSHLQVWMSAPATKRNADKYDPLGFF